MIVPINDKDLEREAATNEVAREKLKEVVRATATYQAQRLIKNWRLDPTLESVLVTNSMLTFDKVFAIYLKNIKVIEETMNFSPYFGWFARQTMVEFLKENGHSHLP